jgi:uncharacterized protein (DUF1800 family)
MNSQRLETSRLFNRFGFGPRPGEYAQALIDGTTQTRTKLLTVPVIDMGAAAVKEPEITDLGKRPELNTAEIASFVVAIRSQTQQLILWWLDRMAASDNGLTEKMTWFWHGHWATSIEKIKHPLPMYKQNKTLRAHCLGNFTDMTKTMLNDGALQFWLDGQENTIKAPNENLGRELMELFVLGVNKYTEDDVKSISRVLTGYQVSRNGDVAINQNRRDKGSVTLLGRTSSFTGDSLSEFLTARDEATTFIAERLWYRFISSTQAMPTSFTAKKAFADRSIAAAVTAMASDSAMRDKKNDMVKAPVEWFISACRALEITPSNLKSSSKLINYLTKLGQVPFSPPSVGGWPAGEAWLSSATAQYRIEFATWLIAQSDLRVLKELPVEQRIEKSADWLGVAEWSPRTQTALGTSINNPQQFALLALCSPEYIVNA